MHSNFGRVVTSEKKEERRGRDRVLAIFVTFSFLKKEIRSKYSFYLCDIIFCTFLNI